MSARWRLHLIFLCLLFCFLASGSALPSDPWDAPAFSVAPDALQRAAAEVKSAKDTGVTVLLEEERIDFDAEGREILVRHTIFRVEDGDGARGWAKSSEEWEPWHQSKPEIKARVITVDGSVHDLDPRTLNELPVDEDSPEVYTDRRAYGGPLPAVAAGAIVEEQITVRDTTPFFRGGIAERHVLADTVPVNKSRFVLSHPESLPLHYVLRLLPHATARESSENGRETVIIENGPLAAVTEHIPYLPGDVVAYPEVEFSTGSDWHQVAEEYAHLTNEKLRASDVQPMLTRLAGKPASRTESISRMVALLHKSVRYTGIEFGESSVIPQFPAETLKRKYGDCKDKAALLVTMLRAAGIPAALALLDAGPGQDVNVSLPGLGMFDHAIVYVPASGDEGELWIDATDEHARAGVLPLMDYGRWALIVDERTTGLTKIPELVALQNFHKETREFTLAEYGPASIVEVNEQSGPMDSSFRDYYSGDAKQLREKNERYVKDVYLADAPGSVEKTDPSDLQKPFVVTYTTKGRRGFTDRESAVVYIRESDLFDELPDYFLSDEHGKKSDDEEDHEGSSPKIPRTVDWQVNPFVTEWVYRIKAPIGYRVRALPANQEKQLGSARLTQTFQANTDGSVVEAVLRFDSGKARLTVEEARVLRDAITKARAADGVTITFDQSGYALLLAGKVKESLALYRLLAAQHPKEALHRVQLAYAYLTAGLGEKARDQARQATQLEPNSPSAFGALGWILQHDLIGRRFKTGFDYKASQEAYRKALQLDPKELDPQNRGTRADYAILLEHNADGVRYAPDAHMDLAISQFREIKKQDEERGKKYDDFVLYDLWYLRQYKELKDEAGVLPGSEDRRALLLAAVAADESPDAAIKKSLEITSEEQDRSKALIAAGFLLLRNKRYPEAAVLYSAGAAGQSESSRLTGFAEIARKSRPFEELKLDDSDPRSAAQRLVVETMRSPLDVEKVLQLTPASVLEMYGKKDLIEKIQQGNRSGRKKIEAMQVPVEASLDIALSNARYSVEGDAEVGYHITMQSPGAAAQQIFVVREAGVYKVQNFLGPNDLAGQALMLVNQGNLAGAHKWLDWARDSIKLGGGEDPLAGPVFPRFWSKGQDGDASAVRRAALAALVDTNYMHKYLPELVQARDGATDASDRTRLNLALAAAYRSQKQWTQLLTVAKELLTAYPDSATALDYAIYACLRMGNLEEWDRLLQSRLVKHPDEAEYLRSQARLAMQRGDVVASRAVLKSLIDSGKASNSDLNLFAWFALTPPAKVDQDAVEAAERANVLTQNSNFAIMHTLACLYAAQGKTKEAREILLKAMDAAALDEPNPAVWLALGQIAEQYGENDAAQAMYARVTKDEFEAPGSNYALAQQHLAALKSAATAARNGAP